MKRVIFDIVLFLSLFALPWWITGILAFSGMFIFSRFYEFLFVWLIFYALYAAGSRVIASPLWFSIIVTGIFIGIQSLRTYIILYKNEIPY
jgi:hypothetical protein